MDGIENDPTRQSTWGVYLTGAEGWFSLFNNDSIVHPYAGSTAKRVRLC